MELTPRQAEFADAALRLLARDGMAAVTFRTVAAEASMSLGAVQKAFPSKDAMLGAMFHRLRETASAPALADPGRPTLRAWLVGLMVAVLPLDEARRAATIQGSAFAERAAFDGSVARAVAASDGELRGSLSLLVRRAIGAGEVARGIDPDAAAWALLAFMQGMAAQLLYDPVDEAAARRQCAWAVDRILGGPAEGRGSG